eukprot:3730316-Prymnesium_polylepis.1
MKPLGEKPPKIPPSNRSWERGGDRWRRSAGGERGEREHRGRARNVRRVVNIRTPAPTTE